MSVSKPEVANGFLAAYGRALQSHPIRTKVITSATLNFLGDTIAQLGIERKKKWDVARTVRYTIFGVIVAPIVHQWYIILSRRHPNLLWRLALDQLVFSPFITAFFLATMSLLEGKPNAIAHKLLNVFGPVFKRRLTVFPLIQFVNFKYVPLEYRAPYGSVIAFLWGIYMSVLANRK
eukprot:TRINITY_DN3835_c0_g1_i1.p1 TRINITY_DN3835_c0_g1~~TRINITY_DN3835_c0_g1_i1.p1  ORF type:complete len:177 (-),score=78.83 TRINITY_DN3835_c0_g1_i1:314-844(-)